MCKVIITRNNIFILFSPHKLVLWNNSCEKNSWFLWPLALSTSFLNLFKKMLENHMSGVVGVITTPQDKLVSWPLVTFSSIILLERRKRGSWEKQRCKRLLTNSLKYCVFIYIQPEYKCNSMHIFHHAIHVKFYLQEEC